MLVTTVSVKKWFLYTFLTLLFMALQGIFLHRIHIWGVLPFIYPCLAAVPATFESPNFATAFSLFLGVICDLLLPEPFPCFYTLTFPLTALVASLISKNLLPAGILCSYAVCVWAFAFHGFFHCFLFMSGGRPAWAQGMFLTLREFVVTVPLFAPLMTPFYRFAANHSRAEEVRRGGLYR